MSATVQPRSGVEGEGAQNNGCPSAPSCTAHANDGSLCAPICAPQCQTKHISTALWISPFEVQDSYGLGRHQGLAIVTVDYTFDQRGPSGAPGSKLHVASLPPDMEKVMLAEDAGTPTHDHTSFALCDAPKIAFDRPLANHGRALSRAPEHRTSRMAEPHHRDVRPSASEDAASEKIFSQCVDRITNGYCDSVCGNCSYVLPSAATQSFRADDWSRPESVVSGGSACEEGGYYGGPDQVSLPTFTGTNLPNPYTHCAHLGCDQQDEAPSMDTAVVSGRFGHNSNTDAEAELRAFRACVDGRDGIVEACAACGNTTEVGRQDPCGARTNTANSIWTETASATSAGLHVEDKLDVIRDPHAGTQLEQPVCAWGKFPVCGM